MAPIRDLTVRAESNCNGGVGAKRRERAEHDGEVDEVADETSRRECDDS